MDTDFVTLRVAEGRDIPELAALWTEAFAGSRPAEERARELREGMPYGSLADCRVLELEGRVAAALRAYRMSLYVRGKSYPTLGLSGVAVAPDFRRRGIGRRVCVETLREGRERGEVLSVLYPFRVGFYQSLGYALAGELHHHRFRPGDLPLYDGWTRVRRGGDADLAAVRELYTRVAERSSGMLARDRGAWRARLTSRSRLYVLADSPGRLSGYVVVASGGRREHPVLHVRELLWEDEESYRALLGWISAQRDQFARATHDALPCEAFHRHFAHPRAEGARRARALWFESARVLRGPMLRVLDVGALQAEDGEGVLHVRDVDLPENDGRWSGGRRVSDGGSPPDGGVAPDAPLPMDEVARAFLAGTLPGQAPPPEGWTPFAPGDPFRLLDEF